MSKVYDDPKYNAAFDRCVDVMARLLQKYGPQLLGQMQETEKDGRTQSAASESNLSLCIVNLTKPLDIN
ncbi:MAG: hypothetical protein ACLTBA_19125 [Roseburia intestinalis]